MTRKRFIKLCMGRLGLSRNEAAALVSNLTNAVIRYRHVKRVCDGVIEYDK